MNLILDFNAVYQSHCIRLKHIAHSITKDYYLAEDVVQEVFIKVWNNLEQLNEENKLGAWLAVITTRTAIDVMRKERNKNGVATEQEILALIADEVQPNVEDEVAFQMLRRDIKQAFGTLKSDYQHVIMLKVDQGLKEKEIAAVLDVNASTVKNRMHRARKKLKITLSDRLSS
ncbi:ECF RNA polymerase sigma factor SigE [Paraliobacillus sp. PM-2]|uniref:RNA polymerase sigma factor n=1 Tax=Paraliobacillus sp. PM-2 TaxID=1462524 RepID=UPI00061C6E6A|nr:sigma-70 family RNA polymerase sigma factor [Paraliobacillus sp. PM-2]CQR47426.1 ECF RNA polymerase sigma factor SigE [Paraliobacillus sp. PM-2]